MNTQEIIPLLGQLDGPKPTLEELNTYVDDAGHRLPTLGTRLHIPTWYYDLMNHDEARRAGWDLADVILWKE